MRTCVHNKGFAYIQRLQIQKACIFKRLKLHAMPPQVDLVADDPAALAHAESLIRSINAGATLHHTTHSVIDLGILLGRGLYSSGVDVPAFASTEPCNTCHDHGRCEIHNLDVQTVNVAVDGPVDEDRLRRLVEGLLWEGAVPGGPPTPRATVFRIKGMLTLAAPDPAEPLRRCMLQVRAHSSWGGMGFKCVSMLRVHKQANNIPWSFSWFPRCHLCGVTPCPS